MKHLFRLLFIFLILSLTACTPKPVPEHPASGQPTDPKMELPVPEEEPTPEKPLLEEPEPEKPVAPKPPPPVPAKPTPKPVPRPPKKPSHVKIDNLILFGRAEYVYLADIKKRLSARIDTGATTSSINATDIQRFERDGKKWVRFVIPYPDGKTSETIEKPLKRDALIKRHGAESIRRPIIMLRVRIGPISTVCEFSLTDRSKFEFPVLIGRNVLAGKAAVDVSRKYTTSPMSQ